MGRAHRIDLIDGWHHVMNRGVDRQTTFFSDADRVEFGRLLGVGFDRFDVEVHAYCLMDTHYHLLLRCPSGGLSEYMQTIGSILTRHINDRVGRDGPLFRGRFHSISVTQDAQLLRTVRYIHRNALDLPGVGDVNDYRWSSHRTYRGFRSTPRWMRTDHVLNSFALGPNSFDDFVRATSSGRLPNTTPEHIRAVTDLVLAELSDHLPGGRQGLARTVQALLVDVLDDVQGRALVAELGYASAASGRAAACRARRRQADEPVLADVVERVVSLL